MAEITDEIRRQVHLEDCAREGHSINPYNLVRPSTDGEIVSVDELQLPSIRCARCGSTWIMIPLRGNDYDDAERRIYQLLPPNSALAKQLARWRGLRQVRGQQS